jgi:glycosyltransferase involved in cell wall biosynthesis
MPMGSIKQKRVSVIIAAYNEERYIGGAIKSILQQTFRDFELIIVDDGSTDRTVQIIKSFNDDRIRLIVNQDNQGVSCSRNRAMTHSSAPHIAVMDAGDVSHPERLEREVAYLGAHPEIGLVGTYAAIIDKNGREISHSYPSCDSREITRKLIKDNCFIHGTIMFRRECLSKIGNYREEFPCAHDYDLTLRISEAYQVANIPEVLYRWRLDFRGISVKRKVNQDAETQLIRELAFRRRVEGSDALQGLPRDEAQNYVQEYIKQYVREHPADRRSRYLWDGRYFWGRKLYYEDSFRGARIYLFKALVSSKFRFPKEGWKMILASILPIRVKRLIKHFTVSRGPG